MDSNRILCCICRREMALAQDVHAEECTGRKWDVTHIPEEIQTASATGIVQSSFINIVKV